MGISTRKVALVGALGLGMVTLTGPSTSSSRQVTPKPLAEALMHRPPRAIPLRDKFIRNLLPRLPSPESFEFIPQSTGMTDPNTTGKIVSVFGMAGLCSVLLGMIGPKREEDE